MELLLIPYLGERGSQKRTYDPYIVSISVSCRGSAVIPRWKVKFPQPEGATGQLVPWPVIACGAWRQEHDGCWSIGSASRGVNSWVGHRFAGVNSMHRGAESSSTTPTK